MQALGHRRQLTNGFNLGAWGGVDAFSSESDNTFVQASGGVELLSEYLEVRINGHFSFSDSETADADQVDFELTDTTIEMVGGKEVPLSGVDAEVGRQFQVTRERIRQIEAKALRKMRHPTRIRKLEGFIELPNM